MNKTFIIIGREFSTRVKKKSFLLVTLLVPILFALFYAFMMWMMLRDDDQERAIIVINESALDEPLKARHNTHFTYVEEMQESAYARVLRDYYAIVRVPATVMERPEIPVYSLSQVPVELKNDLGGQVRQEIERVKRAAVIARVQFPDLEKELDATRTPVTVRTLVVSGAGAGGEDRPAIREGSSEITSFIGMIAGIIIYIFIFGYASQVMRGVIEEKTSRVIEVLVSSVKPFQFLLGKIIGVAAVGLLQFLIWIVFGTVVILAAQAFFLPDLDLESLKQGANLTEMAAASGLDAGQLAVVQNLMKTIDLPFLLEFLGLFLFYFFGGYLLYASLFAAVGAACDSETDSQQFMMPLTIVLLAAFYIGLAAMRNPETPLAFWGSLVPFTSPIVMLVRIPFGVPAWEILASVALLVATFLFFTWLSGKIYRVGILMYGKKATWKELYKWLKY
ncbi:MAG: ABC transporter permease [Odoribacteraceae bacterium]|jgi:ABC-2 type transport system permease protein|nr:ABC transporter permease [Odoribacteraceae bacterium]